MRTERRSTPPIITAAVVLSALGLGIPGTAEAIVPAVQYVTATTVSDSNSPKKAAAACPFGWSVLGGAAIITGAEGQVAIQAAFPVYDAGLGQHLFVVKAVEDLEDGTNGSWSVTAGAYCTNSTVVTFAHQDSPFDSDPIKQVSVGCPAGLKVVGMGGEVSTRVDSSPADLVATVPLTTDVIFHGVEANDDLTHVIARGIEHNALVDGGTFGGSWKVTAVVACGEPPYFDGLELRKTRQLGGGVLEFETDSRLELFCSSKGKKIIAATSSIDDHDQGTWYLDRFSPFGFQNRIGAEAYRNSGTTTVSHRVQTICVDK